MPSVTDVKTDNRRSISDLLDEYDNWRGTFEYAWQW